MTISEIIRAVQSELGVTVDGAAGPETWAAIHKRVVTIGSEVVATGSPVDERSEKNIATLRAEVQPLARALVQQAAAQGIKAVITSGTRTFAEQDALYAQGRTKSGKIVTNARGGYSNHNFGMAFDATIFNGPAPVWESPRYKALGAIGKILGLEWGGNWSTIVDEPHFQLRPPWAAGMSESAMLKELRGGRKWA